MESHQLTVTRQYTKKSRQLIKLIISDDKTSIKIEPNTILRGGVFAPEEYELCPKAQQRFLQSQKVKTLSFADLYAGKICAALDRQHPRDLFDIYLLFENEGLTDTLRQAFVIYLANSNRPMNELLVPNDLDQKIIYAQEFVGMTDLDIPYELLLEARHRLITTIHAALTNTEREFLLSVKRGDPDWALMDLPQLSELPAINWKVLNVRQMNPVQHQLAIDRLREALGI